jgi:uncharacterized protein (DUF983 family)
MGLVWAVIRQRCPRCRKGPVFKGLFATHESCPVCGLVYEREPGYFVGALYASYFFSFGTTLYWLPMLFMGVNPWLVVALPAVHLLLQTPITFRYARVIWLHIDHRFDPEALAANENVGVYP